MPTITPAYLYTFAALIAVSSLLTLSFIAYVNTLRSSSEINRLKDLMNYVAAKAINMMAYTLSTNATVETFVQLPSRIGEKQYWLKLENDPSTSWLKGGFGDNPLEGELRLSLMKNVLANGSYVGGYDSARLTCLSSSGVVQIQLSSEGV